MNVLYCFKIGIFSLLIGISACKSSSEVREDSATGDSVDREAIYWARVDSAKMEFTDADVQFMTGMIAHHAQALIMSRLAPTHGASPAVLTLTKRIINAQKDEIASMQQWLRERGQPVPKVEINGLELTIHGVERKMDHTNMAGMLSPAQLKELDQARGREFDRLFLKYMIGHHKGAVVMVDHLFSKDGAALEDMAFKLASEINVDQKTEIARMQRMLDRMQDTDAK